MSLCCQDDPDDKLLANTPVGDRNVPIFQWNGFPTNIRILTIQKPNLEQHSCCDETSLRAVVLPGAAGML